MSEHRTSKLECAHPICEIGDTITNFERATAIMQSSGYRPFQPDLNHGRAERVLHGRSMLNIEPAASPIDRVIGFVGVVGVVYIAIMLLFEQLARQVAP